MPMPRPLPRMLVILADPQREHSQANRALADAARAAGAEVRDLYTRYPDYLVDVAAEQAALTGAAGAAWRAPQQRRRDRGPCGVVCRPAAQLPGLARAG